MVAIVRRISQVVELSENGRTELCAEVRRHLDRALLLQRYARLNNVAVAMAFEWSEIERLERVLSGALNQTCRRTRNSDV